MKNYTPGQKAYIKPSRYLRIIGRAKNNRLLVYDGSLGGASFLVDEKDLIIVPTAINEDELAKYKDCKKTDDRLK